MFSNDQLYMSWYARNPDSQDFRPCLTQTGMYIVKVTEECYMMEILGMNREGTVLSVVKTKALISCAVVHHEHVYVKCIYPLIPYFYKQERGLQGRT